MRLVSYFLDGAPGVGELRDAVVIPLQGLSEIGAATPAELLRSAVRKVQAAVPISRVILRPAVPNPTKIFCVGLNYLSHVDETKRDLPSYPVLFPKYASSLIAADAPISLPAESDQVDYEGELAVVIGRAGRRIPESSAMDHVLGYTVANDVTVRDYQYKTHQWLQGKAWDGTTPLGPDIVTPDSVDLSTARIRTVLNGSTMQDSDLSKLIFSIPRLIATISEFTELQPGDVILTGTPGGVGFHRDPQVFLRDGDLVSVEIEGVGRINSTVTAEIGAHQPPVIAEVNA
ncbi:fumarylacetoacetate hydrolase family protein [Naasia lichenicola]|uniref:Fumarylacetoacetate hydrolase family protein n=1 Tax=Naasia lichenicola TaxID=2565933 RepID=A0A4V3WTD7_9MICO|nr:fumarylacetoacetate hydrolase family protein [Naasia lichenicola]THG31517.1 fumarylacetoacetate hydrolase family protein [Naasia lichenicola]